MRLHVIGCGDAFGSGGRAQACFLLESGSYRLLLDCGPSGPTELKRRGIAPASLDAVLISHFHGDHFGGLPFLFLEGRYLEPRARPLQRRWPARRSSSPSRSWAASRPGGAGRC